MSIAPSWWLRSASLDEGEERVRSAYGHQWERLVELKRAYDPQNVFRANQNIAP
jgi:FAD/FMN-containing dehydrogenase